MRLRGWLFDAYPAREGMVVWLIADDGRRLKTLDPWRPTAYLGADALGAERVRAWLEDEQGASAALAPARRRELTSFSDRDVIALKVGDAQRFCRLMAGAIRRFPEVEFFNADIPVDRLWFYETGRFPMARVEAEIGDENRLAALTCLDTIWDTDYGDLPLVIMGIKQEGPRLNPAHGGRRGGLEVHVGGELRVLDSGDPETLITRLDALVREHDPDVLVTEYGDSYLFPRLTGLAEKLGVTLTLNRDPDRPPRVTPGRSYFSYGRIEHRDGSWFLHGRWHLDRRNSFMLDQTGFDGLFEGARLARLPVQSAARLSSGTAISCMQIAQAVSDGILVPVEKSRTEDFKSGAELLEVDKGGLVFQPELGLYAGAGELDFASMYPTIMVRHNLSPETVGCDCCRDTGEQVPESGIRVCRRRQGLIPRTLAPLLVKRARYKEIKLDPAQRAESRARAKSRVDAHKWMLVCCFGYLGYRNARFGRIEAHEATTAWGREALLRAKETAEAEGFRVLHAIVDCLWVVRADGKTAGNEEYEALAKAIERDTNLPVAVEGRYRWLAFLPSKEDANRPVAQRYLGVFDSGEIKARCIELRRSDSPPCVVELQERLLKELAKALDIPGARATAAALVEEVRETVREIRAGRMRPEDLAIRCQLSKAPQEYSRPSPGAVAASQLAARGAKLEAGEKVFYVLGQDRPLALQVLEDGAPYDAEKYAEYAVKAAATVLTPFGVSLEELARLCALPHLLPRVRPRPPAAAQLELWSEIAGAART